MAISVPLLSGRKRVREEAVALPAPPIARLTKELLCYIFFKVPIGELADLKQVCRRWRQIFYYPPLHLHLFANDEFLTPSRAKDYLCLPGVLHNYPTYVGQGLELSLNIDSPRDIRDFKTLIACYSHLTTLHIKTNNKNALEALVSRCSTQLPHLTRLNLCILKPLDATNWATRLFRIHSDKLAHLHLSNFPTLNDTKLSGILSYLPCLEGLSLQDCPQVTGTFFQQRSWTNLRSLTLSNLSGLEGELLRQGLDSAHQLHSLELRFCPLDKRCLEFTHAAALTALAQLTLVSSPMHSRDNFCEEMLTGVLVRVQALATLKIMGGYFSGDSFQTCSSTALQSLRSFTYKGNLLKEENLQALFARAPLLRKINLEGIPYFMACMYLTGSCWLTQEKAVFQRVTSLRLCKVYNYKDDVLRYLLERLDSLRKLKILSSALTGDCFRSQKADFLSKVALVVIENMDNLTLENFQALKEKVSPKAKVLVEKCRQITSELQTIAN